MDTNKELLRKTHMMLEASASNILKALQANGAKIEKLDDLIAIQTSDGTWNYDEYQFGLANGLICARAALTGEEPKYLSAPKSWGKNANVGQAQCAEGDRGHGKNGSSEGRIAKDNSKTLRSN